LSRLYDQQVGVVNFSPYYHTTEPDKLVTTKIFTSNIVNVLCPEDILSSEVKNSNQVFSVQSLYLLTENSKYSYAINAHSSIHHSYLVGHLSKGLPLTDNLILLWVLVVRWL